MKTKLNQTFPWGLFTRCGHKLLCADGVLRSAELAPCADTLFSIPASIRIKGKRVKGYASCEEVWETGETIDKQTFKGRVYTFRPFDVEKERYPQLAWPVPFYEYQKEINAILSKGI